MDNEFITYVISNDSLNIYPNNASNSFTVKLESCIHLQDYLNWEFALTEIVYPSAIHTLNGESIVIVGETELHVPTVCCNTVEDLVHHLNGDKNSQFYEFQLVDKRLKLTVHSPYTLILDQALCDILCFDNTIISHDATPLVSSGVPSLTRHIDYMYVYTNIGQYVLVGDSKVPLLRYFPLTTSTKNKSFIKRLYVKLNQPRIEHIEVSIRDGAGELVPFIPNEATQLTLHFRRNMN